jgi:hypothetical protein
MTERPEGTDGGYHEVDHNDYNKDAWQEFTPWRPGDASTAGEAPQSYAADFVPGEGTARLAPEDIDRRPQWQPSSQDSARRNVSTSRSSGGWNEDSRRFQAGDRVRSRARIVGQFGMDHVPDKTNGKVIRTRLGLLGGEYATVAFDNGYVEEIETTAIERRSWWD